jgi:integrase
MRHTTAVLSLEAGARLEEVSQLLGHSSISITKDIYASHVPALSNRAIARMEEFLGSSTAFTPRVGIGS